MHLKQTLTLGTLAFPFIFGACGDATAPGTRSQVAVRFGQSAAGASVVSSIASLSQQGSSAAGAATLTVTGSNGTLNISNVSFIVSEVELDCAGDDDVGPSCADFKAAPTFVKLPFGTGVVNAATGGIPSGVYTELEFEVENLEVDADDDATERAQIAALRTLIRAAHPDFPDKASMIVEGTFTPTGSTQAIPFRTYFDAEIEIEMGLTPPLTVLDAVASRALSVDVQPARWLKRADGTVLDLSRLDYVRTGALVRFELEIKQGFRSVEYND